MFFCRGFTIEFCPQLEQVMLKALEVVKRG
jgi:hypothetical protein